jgi:hypothetical protein
MNKIVDLEIVDQNNEYENQTKSFWVNKNPIPFLYNLAIDCL